MRRLPAIFLAICVLVHPAASQPSGQWVKLYGRINRLFMARNMNAFAAMIDDRFVYVAQDGRTTDKAGFIKEECDPVAAAAWFKSNVKVTRVVTRGDDVDVAYDWRYQMPGSDAAGRFVTHGRELGTDTWHKDQGKWLCTRTKVKSITENRVRPKVRRTAAHVRRRVPRRVRKSPHMNRKLVKAHKAALPRVKTVKRSKG